MPNLLTATPYKPVPAPFNVKEMPRYSEDELNRISAYFDNLRERIDRLEQFLEPIYDQDAYIHGYDIQLLPDGKTLVAIQNPAPTYAENASGTTDHDLSATELWTKVTSDSAALSQDIPIGSNALYSVRVGDNSDRGGIVDLGLGVDGAAPVAVGQSRIVPGNTVFTMSGSHIMTSGLLTGQTFAMWARATNNHLQSDIWVLGTVEPSIIRLETT